jgi:hypothetical protein
MEGENAKPEVRDSQDEESKVFFVLQYPTDRRIMSERSLYS